MTLMEKFATLTPEQREKFAEVKDAAALDAFVSEQGIDLTDEEKTQTLEYIKTGVLPLDDDELDAAAGGLWGYMDFSSFGHGDPMAEGRSDPVGVHPCGCEWQFDIRWPSGYVYADYLKRTPTKPGVAIATYYDVKCYKCGRQWSELTP